MSLEVSHVDPKARQARNEKIFNLKIVHGLSDKQIGERMGLRARTINKLVNDMKKEINENR